MGEPAVPTPADRVQTLVLATGIVESVRNDEEWPHEMNYLSSAHTEVDKDKVFRLAQDLVDTRAALEQACDLADEGFSRGWDRLDRKERTDRIARLRKLDLEIR